MLLSWVNCLITDEKVVELFQRARQHNFYDLLLFCINYLRIEKVYLNIGLIQNFHLIIIFLRLFHLILILRGKNLRRQCFFLPKSINNFVSIIILEPWKNIFLFLFPLIFNIVTNHTNRIYRYFCNSRDSLYFNSWFFDNSKHIGYKHEMFLSNVQPSKEREVNFEYTFVILKYRLVG